MQYLFLPIVSLVFVLVTWFISKTQLEKNANECLLINISYIELSSQYFLINIVLSRFSNQNYKGLLPHGGPGGEGGGYGDLKCSSVVEC